MPRTKWTDERVEDLGKVVYHNDGVLEDAMRSIERLSFEVQEMKSRQAGQDRSRFQRIAIGAALCSPLVTLVLDLVYHAH